MTEHGYCLSTNYKCANDSVCWRVNDREWIEREREEGRKEGTWTYEGECLWEVNLLVWGVEIVCTIGGGILLPVSFWCSSFFASVSRLQFLRDFFLYKQDQLWHDMCSTFFNPPPHPLLFPTRTDCWGAAWTCDQSYKRSTYNSKLQTLVSWLLEIPT